jgi:hypothetical protein
VVVLRDRNTKQFICPAPVCGSCFGHRWHADSTPRSRRTGERPRGMLPIRPEVQPRLPAPLSSEARKDTTGHRA